MSIAVIKGKVSHSGSEDILTASVFGPLRYLSFNEFLKPILEQSKNLAHQRLKLSYADHMPDLIFWPTRYRREPDMELTVGQKKLFIEVKFHSSKSGEGKHDQLANQYVDLHNDLQHLQNTEGTDGAIIYLTKDRLMPEEILYNSIRSEGIKEENRDKFRSNLYWLSWFDVWSFISKKNEQISTFPDTLILQDLCELLEKQELAHFTGFRVTNKDVVRETEKEKIFYYESRKR